MATEKQRRAIKKIQEGMSVSRAMIESGYSEKTARDPSALTKSKAYVEILEKAGITDEKLAEVMRDGLEATDANGNKDHAIRHRYLETAQKAKGHTGADNTDKQLTGVVVVLNERDTPIKLADQSMD